MYALVDYDPDGIAIMRTYKHGSQGLEHEQNSTVPELRWLGIRSSDLLDLGDLVTDPDSQGTSTSGQHSQSHSSQESIAFSSNGTGDEPPKSLPRLTSTR